MAGRHRVVAGALVGLSLVSASCGGLGRSSEGATRTETSASYDPNLQDNPLDMAEPFRGAGTVVPSVEAAQDLLPFQVHDPQGLGPATIYVSPQDRPAALMAVYFVYQTSPYGEVWIAESFPDIPDDEERLASYEATVASNGDPQVHSIAQVVTVRNGIPALTGTSDHDDIATIEWVEEGVQFYVKGPTLTQDQVLSIANSI